MEHRTMSLAEKADAEHSKPLPYGLRDIRVTPYVDEFHRQGLGPNWGMPEGMRPIGFVGGQPSGTAMDVNSVPNLLKDIVPEDMIADAPVVNMPLADWERRLLDQANQTIAVEPTPAEGEGEFHRPGQFREELRQLINRYSQESHSNTPDFILAGYLNDSLNAFDRAVNRRTNYYQ